MYFMEKRAFHICGFLEPFWDFIPGASVFPRGFYDQKKFFSILQLN